MHQTGIIILGNGKERMHTQKNSFAKTTPRFDPGVTYSARAPAGPLGVKATESNLPDATRVASTAYALLFSVLSHFFEEDQTH